MTSLLVVTRVHMQASSRTPDINKIIEFIQHTLSYADKLLICVSTDNTQMLAYVHNLRKYIMEESLLKAVRVLEVNPWGHFVTSLNAAIQYAQDNDFNRIAFQSVEFRCDKNRIHHLLQLLETRNILVAGPEMTGHEFCEGDNLMRGRTTPWNTLSIWNVDYLGITGFPLIGDGTGLKRDIGGVEEVSAINLLQLINPRFTALLVRFNNIHEKAATPSPTTAEWDTTFADASRQSYHNAKMQSKDDRPAKQQQISGIPAGIVKHIVIQLD